jgi:hypothetical protein
MELDWAVSDADVLRNRTDLKCEPISIAMFFQLRVEAGQNLKNGS